MIDWKIILSIITGLIIFIYAIEHFSKEIQEVAGDRFRKLFGFFVKNRASSTLFGALATAVIQSSAATTVITAGLVNAGIISFAQSLGVLLGADIGTTITAQLIAFKITDFAPIFIIIGFVISFFGRSWKYAGKGLFYLGLLFFGLTLISQAVEPLKADPLVLGWFSHLSSIYVGVLVGLVLTALVQSSSVTVGIVVVLAGSGLITLQQSIPLILGANIGTTSTTFIASIRMNIFAKRVAVAHGLFKVIGVLLVLPFIAPFTNLIASLGGSPMHQVANAHTIFNVAIVFVFLFALTPFRKLVEFLLPTKEKEILLATKYLPEKLPDSNSKVFDLIEKELKYSLEITFDSFEQALSCLKNPSNELISKIEKLETLSDLIDEKIEGALLELSRRKLNEKEAKQVVLLVRISNAIEQWGDTARDLSKLPKSMKISSFSLSEESYRGIEAIYRRIREAFVLFKKDFPRHHSASANKIAEQARIERLISKSYRDHVERLKARKVHTGSMFVESVSILEQSLGELREMIVLTREYSKLKERKYL